MRMSRLEVTALPLFPCARPWDPCSPGAFFVRDRGFALDTPISGAPDVLTGRCLERGVCFLDWADPARRRLAMEVRRAISPGV